MDTVYLDITADVRDDEWVESAENEPDEEELWWNRMLAEEVDEQC